MEFEKLYETHFAKHHGKEAKEALLVGSNGFHSVALRIQSPSQNGFMEPKYYAFRRPLFYSLTINMPRAFTQFCMMHVSESTRLLPGMLKESTHGFPETLS